MEAALAVAVGAATVVAAAAGVAVAAIAVVAVVVAAIGVTVVVAVVAVTVAIAAAAVMPAVAATAANKRALRHHFRPDVSPAFFVLSHWPYRAYRAYKKRFPHSDSASGFPRYSPNNAKRERATSL